MGKPRLLLVEDDSSTRKAYSAFLRARGFCVIEASTGDDALDLVPKAEVILLDVMLPGINGWEVAEHIKSCHPDKPVIMLTALGTRNQKLFGFQLGVDDYMVKPIDLFELEARINARMRPAGQKGIVHSAGLRIDLDKRTAEVQGRMVALTPLEFDLLLKLIEYPGKVWTRSELITSVWGEDYFGVDRTVDVRVSSLRKKLGKQPSGEQFIETIRKHGYRFCVPKTDGQDA